MRAFCGHGQRHGRKPAVPRGEHAHGRAGEPAQCGGEQPVLRVLRCGGRDEHERVVSGRQLDVLGWRLPHERPDDVRVRGPAAWVLELGKRGDERELAADAAVDIVERGAGRGSRVSR